MVFWRGCAFRDGTANHASIKYVLCYRQKVRHQTCRKPPNARTPPPLPLIVTHGARCLPPTGSTAGFALSPTPPQGGSDTGAPYASLKITPPLRGSRRSRAARQRLMRWGVEAEPPGAGVVAVFSPLAGMTTYLATPGLGVRLFREQTHWSIHWVG